MKLLRLCDTNPGRGRWSPWCYDGPAQNLNTEDVDAGAAEVLRSSDQLPDYTKEEPLPRGSPLFRVPE